MGLLLFLLNTYIIKKLLIITNIITLIERVFGQDETYSPRREIVERTPYICVDKEPLIGMISRKDCLPRPSSSVTVKEPLTAMMNSRQCLWAWPPRQAPDGTSYVQYTREMLKGMSFIASARERLPRGSTIFCKEIIFPIEVFCFVHSYSSFDLSSFTSSYRDLCLIRLQQHA